MAGILVAKNLLPGIAPEVNLYIAKAITSAVEVGLIQSSLLQSITLIMESILFH